MMVPADEMGLSVLDVVLQFFQEDQWSYQKSGSKPSIRAGYRGEHGTWVCYARFEKEEQRFYFQSLMGLNIPPAYRLSVIDFLKRVNTLLSAGNFEMDIDTGDVRFKTSMEISEEQVNLQAIRSLAYYNVNWMDHCFPGVAAIVYGGLSPAAALSRVELSPAVSTAGSHFSKSH